MDICRTIHHHNSEIPIGRIRVSNLPKSLLLPPFAALLVIYHLVTSVVRLNSIDPPSAAPAKVGQQLRPDLDVIIDSVKEGTIDTSPFDRKDLLPAFHRYTEKFEVSKRYKLSICSIPKIMSTFGTSLVCYLKNPAKFKAYGRRISTEKWATSLCSKRYVHSNYTLSERELGSTRIAFIREPIDRFLSGFVNKCILKTSHETDSCYGCGASLSCFVEEFRKQLWEVYTRNDSNYRFLITNTLAPQTWFCDFKEHVHDYTFIRYGNQSSGGLTMISQLHDVLEQAGIPLDLRHEILVSMLDGKSHHSTYFTDHRSTAAKELYSNHTLLKMVTELYYYDFVVFDYPLPKI